MQRILIIFTLLAFSSSAHTSVSMEEVKLLWSSWRLYNERFYTTTEETARFAIFTENYKKIISFNAAHEDVKLTLNKFADLTATEFKSLYGSGYVKKNNRAAPKTNIDFGVLQLPTSVDWRDKGAVTKVKNQGQCGSCWTFATTGVLEGWYQINKGKLLSFSEQQIVDCDKNDDGCDGGDPVEALTYTAQNGLELELTYPYTAEDDTCKFQKAVAIKTNVGSNLVIAQDTEALKAALVAQPVSVAIEADEDIFQLYSSGVIKNGCGDNLDHAVLTVGYAMINSEEAFIVKNSWGQDWGQEGYVYLSTSSKYNNGNGACGILSQPVVPTN